MTHTATLYGNRAFAIRMVEAAPKGSVMTIKPPRRTIDQNALMWSLLTLVSAAKPEGRTLTPDVWKALFLHSLDHSQRFEAALDGNGMVPVGFRSSKLSKAQMSDLIETIHEYAARHGIELDRVSDGNPQGGDGEAGSVRSMTARAEGNAMTNKDISA